MKEKHAENIVLVVALLGLLVMGGLSWMKLNGKHLRTAALKQLVLPSKTAADDQNKSDSALLESDSDHDAPTEVNYADPDTESNEHPRPVAQSSSSGSAKKQTPSRVKGEPSFVVNGNASERPETPSR